MMFYTYLHRRADDLKPFYIGKGKDDRAYRKNHRNPHWHRTVAKHGLVVEILAKWPTEVEAFEHEKFLIKCFRECGHGLANMSDGGEGQSGWVPSAETREKIGLANKGRVSKLRGVPLTDETKAKLRSLRQGTKMSDSAKAKMSASQKGKPKSAEHAKKIGIGRLGWVPSDETKRKISESHKGKELSTEHRLAISSKLKGRKQSPEQIEAARLGRIATGGKTDKPVLCVETGQKFRTLGEAARWLQQSGLAGATKSTISRVCNGLPKYKTAYGYTWKFINQQESSQ
jgi:hypothetical protein